MQNVIQIPDVGPRPGQKPFEKTKQSFQSKQDAALKTKTVSPELKYDFDLINQLNVAKLIHLVRYTIFDNVPAEQLKKTLTKLPYCQIVGNEKLLCDIFNEGNFAKFEMFVNKTQINRPKLTDAIKSKLKDTPGVIEFQTIIKNPDEIMDIYFNHENSAMAYNALSHLFDVSFQTQTECDEYMHWFSKLSKEEQGESRAYRC